MSVKIRLRRYGRKKRPFYRIVVINSKTKRDGKYIDTIGTYDTNINPSSIRMKLYLAIKWLNRGAVASDTVYSILSKSGVLYKRFLERGVNKNIISKSQADDIFNAWIKNKKGVSLIHEIDK
ncbi:MAG: 30S ribosomal protein S16 [Bacteroides sp.]|nr:MAG: 30S ribosomal protein S16 [Bacteroides sp.]